MARQVTAVQEDISVSCVLGYKRFQVLRPDVQSPRKSSKMEQDLSIALGLPEEQSGSNSSCQLLRATPSGRGFQMEETVNR